ncbi:MAG: ATP-binding protein [Candidatus Pristimantibacillus sp.]
MRVYENGRQHIQDEMQVLERGIRQLLHDYESREPEGHSSPSLRGLVITPQDIERTLQADSDSDFYDPLDEFRAERIQSEKLISEIVTASLRNGTSLPLVQLSWGFQLTMGEKRCILLGLAAEIDSRFDSWFGYLNDDVTLRTPTIELSLRLICDNPNEFHSARGLLIEGSKLMRFIFKSTNDGAAAMRSSLRHPLRLDQRIISFLLETERLDSRLVDCVSRYETSERLEPLLYDNELQEQILRTINRELDLAKTSENYNNYRLNQSMTFIQLSGPAGAGKKLHVKHLAQSLNKPLLIVRIDRLPDGRELLLEKLRQLVREAIMTGALIAFYDTTDMAIEEDKRLIRQLSLKSALTDYHLENYASVVIWLNREVKRQEQLPVPDQAIVINEMLKFPDADIRLLLWQNADKESTHSELLPELADKYKFTPGQIAGTFEQAKRLAFRQGREVANLRDYEEASRTQVQHKLSELADKLQPARAWEDLILPEEPLMLLKEAISRHRYSETVYRHWGFDRKLPYGRGLSMLFAGPPGTGKTMAAEVMASELGLELYRIDLSRVVSKYIGETEKNLRELFAEAENSGSILFFDEGDSLFGKRTEIKDSHDRYANMEAAYLLQRIEAFDGVSILASNLQQNMDEAFLRRMQIIVQFPFPDAIGRERIFRSLLPKEAPLDEDLDLFFLAERIEAAGGHIKNIVLAAAFLAAAEGRPIGMRHMVRAGRQELQKMGKIVVKEMFEPYL